MGAWRGGAVFGPGQERSGHALLLSPLGGRAGISALFPKVFIGPGDINLGICVLLKAPSQMTSSATLLGPQLTDWVQDPWPLLDGLRSEAIVIVTKAQALGLSLLTYKQTHLLSLPGLHCTLS